MGGALDLQGGTGILDRMCGVSALKGEDIGMIIQSMGVRVRGLAMIGLAAAVSGCASYRIETTPIPGKPAAQTQGPKYTIAAATLSAVTNVGAGGIPDFGVVAISNAELTVKLAGAAVKLRPDVFSRDPGAVPVEVAVTRTAYDSSIGVGGCVSCITLTIYPLRTSGETVYTVEVTRPDPTAGPQTSAPVSLTRRETSWLSILPGAWIPVPGGSGERSWGTDSAIQKTGEKMLAACVEAAAQALIRREPSAWRKAGEPPPAPAEAAGTP